MELTRSTDVTRAYRDAEHTDDKKLQRFTIYAKWVSEEYIEEIDVDALDRSHAGKVAKAALQSDYDPGGRVAKIISRPRGFMYM